ncbi:MULTISPECIES: hypothetical protein [Streptomyces]|uniref:hypothetical protein n=1 Tax=Streptomyces lycopersici TaxID=2974589 RepID=UPI0021CF88EA|nr:hypothetical protein [Streptomyces sp. NEAU-383]
MLQFTDAEIQTKAEQLGLVRPGQPIPTAAMASTVKAALVEERRASARAEKADKAQLAKSIVVQPNGAILVDGEPFPWLISQDPMEIDLRHDGSGSVRLTLLVENVQIIKPEPTPDSNESE